VRGSYGHVVANLFIHDAGAIFLRQAQQRDGDPYGVSLVIPCHRALREDGDLGGYRWGLEFKAALLEGEADHPE
jgi:AraC family transcriptional regulator of adaptative response/methylated-DNA-[protein]-cysteine methyltransferase